MAKKTLTFIVLIIINLSCEQEILRLKNLDTADISPGKPKQTRQLSEESIDRSANISSNGVTSSTNENDLSSLIDEILAEYNKGKNSEDVHLSIDKLIIKYGYPAETHQTVTEDGYKLKMFRIPSNGSVVFLMHGLFSSSDDFVVGGPTIGLAYLLASEGYDVWLGNSRGNQHSRRHNSLNTSQKQYWDFSWHEIGYYDIPAMIDYALNKTGQQKLKFIGHSQGTTSFWVTASERPEYNDKIALMVALAPSAFLSRMTSPFIRISAYFNGVIHALASSLGISELTVDTPLVAFFRQLVCGFEPLSEIICTVMLMSTGFDLPQLNFTNLPVIIGHFPPGASSLQVVHYAQIIVSKRFRKYDHGAVENMKRYGSLAPPDYELQKITAPVSLFYSDNDWIIHPDDVSELSSKLPNVVLKHKIKYKYFNHLDYLFAKDLKTLLFKRLRRLISKY